MELVNGDLVRAGTGDNLGPVQVVSDSHGTDPEYNSLTRYCSLFFYGRVKGLKQIEFRGFLGALSQAASQKDK
jgi:hypothetical protein